MRAQRHLLAVLRLLLLVQLQLLVILVLINYFIDSYFESYPIVTTNNAIMDYSIDFSDKGFDSELGDAFRI